MPGRDIPVTYSAVDWYNETMGEKNIEKEKP
jgi:hypothetical protein